VRQPDHAGLLYLLPQVEIVLADPRLSDLAGEPRPLVRAWAREVLEDLRREIRAGIWQPSEREEATARVVTEIRSRAGASLDLHLRPVWNATGVLLHTNLGRAVLPVPVCRALLAAASGYSSLEINLDTGQRASRLEAIRELIPLLTGAEAGFAVNNNAAALFLAVAALAGGREVMVSRGQLVEIGGSFRLPDILEAAGVRLREVGTTNRTRIADFERARSADSALVLRVHRSNFNLTGFTEEPSLEEMVAFCRGEQLPLVDDVGSGALRAHRDLFPSEPYFEDSIQAGADLVCSSADKLLGLTQAGILAGKQGIVDRLAKHPIARIVRLDKTLLAGLEAGLRIHLRGPEEARQQVPLLRALSRTPEAILTAVGRCAEALSRQMGERFEVATVSVRGEVGGGSLPGVEVDSYAVALRSAGASAETLAVRLRAGKPPVIGRIQGERMLLDLRAIDEEEEEAFVGAVARALCGGEGA